VALDADAADRIVGVMLDGLGARPEGRDAPDGAVRRHP
jgi:hypothetical protein